MRETGGGRGGDRGPGSHLDLWHAGQDLRCGGGGEEVKGGGRGGEAVRLSDDGLVVDLHSERRDEQDDYVVGGVLAPLVQSLVQ